MKTNGQLSIFLVDDDTMFLRSMEHHLLQKMKESVRIRTFPTGEECLKKLDEKPDIVVLDYLLNSQYPNAMNGIQVLDNIKQASPGAAVVMLSAQDKMEIAVDTMRHGAYDYVVKNENTFLRTQNVIRNAINSISLSKELSAYKLWMKIIVLFIVIAGAAATVMEIYFRDKMY